jgi:hypothetical protein
MVAFDGLPNWEAGTVAQTGDQTGGASGPITRELRITETTQAMHEAPVIQIDGAQSFGVIAGLVKFNCFQDRLISGAGDGLPVERIVCARMVMTPVVVKQLADWLSKNTQQMIEVGGLIVEESSQKPVT